MKYALSLFVVDFQRRKRSIYQTTMMRGESTGLLLEEEEADEAHTHCSPMVWSFFSSILNMEAKW